MGALEDIDPVKISRPQDDLLPTVQALAELWQDGPHDLINSPFSLPSVVQTLSTTCGTSPSFQYTLPTRN
jgi:hypothetical protein